jgi:hypothetical protein
MIETFPPDVICIGAQKACTSWLNLILKSDKNKSVFVPYLKETFFLNLLEEHNNAYPGPLSEVHSGFYREFKKITESTIKAALSSLDLSDIKAWESSYLEYLFASLSHYWTGLDSDWYQNLFSIANPNQLLCEITPDYSLLDIPIIKELSIIKPNLKIILTSRDPVARDLSQLRMQLLPQVASPSDQECLDFLEQRHVRDRSDYKGILKKWRNFFPDQSILTFDTAEVSSNPFAVLAKINEFLGVCIDVDEIVLFSRDNVGPRGWRPSEFILASLNKYYARIDPS